jgi:hypothetical protein
MQGFLLFGKKKPDKNLGKNKESNIICSNIA